MCLRGSLFFFRVDCDVLLIVTFVNVLCVTFSQTNYTFNGSHYVQLKITKKIVSTAFP